MVRESEPLHGDGPELEQPFEQTHQIIHPESNGNRLLAIERLGALLQSPEEQQLRAHQWSMLTDVHTLLSRGEHAGYIDAATGVGKTAAMVTLAKAIGGNALIMSPTRVIADQNVAAAHQFAPGLHITQYDGRYKDLSGDAISTTTDMAFSLSQNPPEGFDPKKITLLLCDEVDLSLGELQHTLFRAFPQAIKIGFTGTAQFKALDRLIKDGLVREDEEWVGMFRNLIHKLSLEEAIYQGILSDVHVHVLQTGIFVGRDQVNVTSSGEYSQRDLAKEFTKSEETAFAVGIVAGLDAIPPDVVIKPETREEIEGLHTMVAGKRTVIFTGSIAHAEALTALLNKQGIASSTIHSRLEEYEDEREIKERIDGFQGNTIQVLSGVDMLSRGIDTKAAEATIHIAPHYSPRKLLQELGRGTRLSPETGKERLIAIQLAYKFQDPLQSPISLLSVFDADFLEQAPEVHPSSPGALPTKKLKPSITVSGVELGVALHEIRMIEFGRARLPEATASEMSNYLMVKMDELRQAHPDATIYELCQAVVHSIPEKIAQERQQVAFNALKNADATVQETGRLAFLLLNLKTLISAVDTYLFEGESERVTSLEERDELMQIALTSFASTMNRMTSPQNAAQIINRNAKLAIAADIAAREFVPKTIALTARYRTLIRRTDDVFADRTVPFTHAELLGFAQELAVELMEEREEPNDYEKIDERRKALYDYLVERNNEVMPLPDEIDPADSSTTPQVDSPALQEALSTLTERERDVIGYRFGFYDPTHDDYTLEETGRKLEITKERVRQIEGNALRKLRKPMVSRMLRDSFYK